MRVYIVISSHGDYEDHREDIEGVFSTRKKAVEFMERFDAEHYIKYDPSNGREDSVYNIVPKDIFDDWPYTEPDDPNEDYIYDKEYRGYTIDDYHRQEGRLDLWYQNYRKCHIETFEVE